MKFTLMDLIHESSLTFHFWLTYKISVLLLNFLPRIFAFAFTFFICSKHLTTVFKASLQMTVITVAAARHYID